MPDVQVQIRQTYFTKLVMNVTNWDFPDFETLTIQEFADAVRATYVTNVVADMSNNWTLDGLNVRIFNGAGPYSIDVAFTSGQLTGTNTNHFLPRQVALLIATTHLGPPPNRGRIFFPGLTEAPSDEGSWDTATLIRYRDLVEDWIGGLSTTAGNCSLLIANVDYVNNVFTNRNLAEGALARNPAATIRNRR